MQDVKPYRCRGRGGNCALSIEPALTTGVADRSGAKLATKTFAAPLNITSLESISYTRTVLRAHINPMPPIVKGIAPANTDMKEVSIIEAIKVTAMNGQPSARIFLCF